MEHDQGKLQTLETRHQKLINSLVTWFRRSTALHHPREIVILRHNSDSTCWCSEGEKETERSELSMTSLSSILVRTIETSSNTFELQRNNTGSSLKWTNTNYLSLEWDIQVNCGTAHKLSSMADGMASKSCQMLFSLTWKRVSRNSLSTSQALSEVRLLCANSTLLV